MNQSENKSNGKKAFLQQLITLDDLDIFKQELINEFKKLLKEHGGKPSKQWLKTEEVKKMLNVSTGTLQTLRINGTLPYTRIGGVIYYDADDIQQMFVSRKFQHAQS
ncbi:helix-turn-helix protein [Mucilaginibacter gracilis]|uniref:Helix-turn-helix protein n=1 Tax=Mucilaginibacter gracilis TaxID=423350 RepID=A0A495IVE7_9SPHI|nr:helix-turn-helix domain-containing protein [Mucilaginibacter gracilis]RKR80725.1 helix-turn-helix protein [Mucilaginibacter gracilis]